MPQPKHPRFPLKLIVPPEPPQPAAPVSEETAIREFVARVGGLENAKSALELWSLLDAADRKRPRAA